LFLLRVHNCRIARFVLGGLALALNI